MIFKIVCRGCGEAFEAGTPCARWCSARCKKRAQRAQWRSVSPAASEPGGERVSGDLRG